MKFKPCIDIHAGVVKQIVGSTLKDSASGSNGEEPKTNFSSNKPSSYFAELYYRDGLKGGHVIMLGGGQDNRRAAMDAIKAFPGGLQVGGGINPSNAKEYLDAGASHVIVTSYVFKNGEIDFTKLSELLKAVGSKEKLVLDLSCRTKAGENPCRYYVVTDRWQKFTNFEITKETLEMLSKYCSEFLVHGVDVEGMRVGVMGDLIEKLGMWSPIPVTYAGGARSIEDLELVKRLGNGKIDLTIGSALDIFGGDLPYSTVVTWHYANLELHEIDSQPIAVAVSAARALLAAEETAKHARDTFEQALEQV